MVPSEVNGPCAGDAQGVVAVQVALDARAFHAMPGSPPGSGLWLAGGGIGFHKGTAAFWGAVMLALSVPNQGGMACLCGLLNSQHAGRASRKWRSDQEGSQGQVADSSALRACCGSVQWEL